MQIKQLENSLGLLGFDKNSWFESELKINFNLKFKLKQYNLKNTIHY